MRLILASESARRKDLLRSVGIEPTVVPSGVEEGVVEEGDDPASLVVYLARQKVDAVSKRYPSDYILGADTVVSIDGNILGKPKNALDAQSMLTHLSGKTHQVYTGVVLYDPNTSKMLSDWDRTEVTFKELDEEEVTWYVATKEPMDKAGAYGLQGAGAFFVRRVVGDYSGVIGLPLPKTYDLLKRSGLKLNELMC